MLGTVLLILAGWFVGSILLSLVVARVLALNSKACEEAPCAEQEHLLTGEGRQVRA